jgi:hypothetical protein
MKIKGLLFIFAIYISVPTCFSLEIITHENKYEKIFFGNYRFTFDFHLENLAGSENVNNLVKVLIYKNKDAEEYISVEEKGFIGDIHQEDYPPMIDDDGTEYFYHSDLIETYEIKHYNDYVIIIEYNDYFYYSGSAHGNFQRKYLIIDILEEKILDIPDVITQVPEKLLIENIIKKYTINYYLRENIWPPDTISFEKEKLILYWNIYSITPYATGPIMIEMDYEMIKNFLRNKGLQIINSLE